VMKVVVTEEGVKTMRDAQFRSRLLGILEELRASGLIH